MVNSFIICIIELNEKSSGSRALNISRVLKYSSNIVVFLFLFFHTNKYGR